MCLLSVLVLQMDSQSSFDQDLGVYLFADELWKAQKESEGLRTYKKFLPYIILQLRTLNVLKSDPPTALSYGIQGEEKGNPGHAANSHWSNAVTAKPGRCRCAYNFAITYATAPGVRQSFYFPDLKLYPYRRFNGQDLK